MKTAIAKAAVAIHPVVIIVAAVLGAGGCVSGDEPPAEVKKSPTELDQRAAELEQRAMELEVLLKAPVRAARALENVGMGMEPSLMVQEEGRHLQGSGLASGQRQRRR
ncbi:hypothetical protein IEQ34_015706 [Dendrobium chrysotoxum]|uniref:Uncharacterized protein n=1 Tax=Dendrobium chrysotoxum TaxID=161865 RepID=A0AAV7GJ65_DENCH|nr:hypothetical protein IEQ34_015706 [Dendrobium chrysotoxum]